MTNIDKVNRFALSIQVLALLVSVCFTSSLSPLSGNRPRLPRSSSGCTLTLYDGDIGSSPSLELTTTDSSFVNDDWDDRASSAVVSGGCQWVLYDTDFEENSTISSVVGPGNYPFNFSSNETTFGLPDNVLSAVRCLPPEGTPAIVLFEHHRYFGRMQVINSSNPNLALINFDNLVSSLVITGGVWELYSEVNYTGSNVTLGQGLYPNADNLTPIENDDLTSVSLTAMRCEAETTGLLSWPATLAGTTQTLHCPNTATMINRTCSVSGMWERVDLSLCTLASINATVMNLVRTLQNQNGDQLQASASNIVRTFETIVSVAAQQLDDRQSFTFKTENFVFHAELLPQAELAQTGRSFLSSGETRNTNISTLSGNITAVVSSGGAPTPAGTSVFTKHNWDMGMGYLWLNWWGIYHLMVGAFMAYWVGHL